MRLPRPRIGSRARRTVVAVVVLVGSVLVLPSGAVQSDEPNRTEGQAAADDLPTGEGYVLAGVVSSTQGAVSRRSKTYITLGPDNPIIGILRYARFNDPIENPTRYSARVANVDWPFGPVPCATVPVDQYKKTRIDLSDLTVVTITDDGKPKEVGALPDTTVRLVAFGSIPATATLSMKMVRKNGAIQPWTVATWVTGATNFPGCDGPTANSYFRTLIAGQVQISLSDLVVDGVPVDLGPSCRAAHPADVWLWGVKPYIPLQGGSLGQYEGVVDRNGDPLRGSTGPLDSPYYQELNGKSIPDPRGVDIPPFIGCGSGGDDLSPLVTAMASGPNNPVRVNQGGPMFTPYDPDDLLKCDSPSRCPLPAPAAPEMPPLPDGETP